MHSVSIINLSFFFFSRRESFEQTDEDLFLNCRRFDVDVSQVRLSSFLERLHANLLLKLPCGLNGALYFSQMDADGGVAKSAGANKAGAKYGTGYCDSQCPRDIKFINGVANSEGWTPSPNDGTPPFLSCLLWN